MNSLVKHFKEMGLKPVRTDMPRNPSTRAAAVLLRTDVLGALAAKNPDICDMYNVKITKDRHKVVMPTKGTIAKLSSNKSLNNRKLNRGRSTSSLGSW